MNFVGDQVEGLVPGDRLEALAIGVSQERLLEAIAAVEQRRQVIALDAEQALVDGAQLIAADRHDLPFGDADFDAASRAAEPAGRLAPGHIALRQAGFAFGSRRRFAAAAERRCRGSSGGTGQQEIAALHG